MRSRLPGMGRVLSKCSAHLQTYESYERDRQGRNLRARALCHGPFSRPATPETDTRATVLSKAARAHRTPCSWACRFPVRWQLVGPRSPGAGGTHAFPIREGADLSYV